METKQQVRVKKLVKELRQWCATPHPHLHEKAKSEIPKSLASTGPYAAGEAAVHLGFLGDWYGQYGTLAILDGQINGWTEIDRSFRYSWWSTRINMNMTLASTVAALLANAIVWDDEAMADSFAERMNSKIFGASECSAHYPFVLKLWGLYRGREVDVARPRLAPLGVYQGVLDAWHDEAKLRRALSDACDYHLEQTRETPPYPEFIDPPLYCLFPVDILAIGTVRKKLGLPMPHVDHPLLATPLATVPPAEDRPRMGPDPLLEQVIDRAKKDGLL